MGRKKAKPNYRRVILRLPDLDQSKRAVLNALSSPNSRRVYEHAIDKFIAWYCSEPRLAFNRIVLVRYRIHLESCSLAANTINQHLAAVRRLAHEAADAGLLSPDLAAALSSATFQGHSPIQSQFREVHESYGVWRIASMLGSMSDMEMFRQLTAASAYLLEQQNTVPSDSLIPALLTDIGQ